MEHCNNGRFKILERLSESGFASVYLGKDTGTGDDVAIKISTTDTPYSHFHLIQETKMYRELAKKMSSVPKVIWFGSEKHKGKKYFIFVLEKLGKSLKDQLKESPKGLSLQKVVRIAFQVVSLLEKLHKLKIVHRDIKPANFLRGLGKYSGDIYVIDFGLSIHYWDWQRDSHIPCRSVAAVGTKWYMSVNTHLKKQQSRRDDLESVGYMLVSLKNRSLPWRHLKKMEDILSMKQNMSSENLCSGLPEEFVEYFNYCRSLDFNEDPDYNYLKSLFERLIRKKKPVVVNAETLRS